MKFNMRKDTLEFFEYIFEMNIIKTNLYVKAT